MELISTGISQNLTFETDPEEKDDDWRDAGLLLMIPMAVLLLLWFRKGWVIYLFPLFLITSCSDGSEFSDLWFTKDYQGQRLSDKGAFGEAADRFQDPMHKGVAWFKAGNYEEAIEAFRQDTTAEGAYNLGLSYLSNFDTTAAIFAFGKAAEMDPELTSARDAGQLLTQRKGGTDELNPEDIQEAKAQQTAENNENQMLSIGKSLFIYNKVDSLEVIRKKIEAITDSQILEVSNEIFLPHQLSQIMYL